MLGCTLASREPSLYRPASGSDRNIAALPARVERQYLPIEWFVFHAFKCSSYQDSGNFQPSPEPAPTVLPHRIGLLALVSLTARRVQGCWNSDVRRLNRPNWRTRMSVSPYNHSVAPNLDNASPGKKAQQRTVCHRIKGPGLGRDPFRLAVQSLRPGIRWPAVAPTPRECAPEPRPTSTSDPSVAGPSFFKAKQRAIGPGAPEQL